MRRPDLGGEEDVVARHAGGAHALTDLALIVVHLRGVDMPVSEPQRLLDEPGASAATQLPGAKPDCRNARTTGLDHLHDDLHDPFRAITP